MADVIYTPVLRALGRIRWPQRLRALYELAAMLWADMRSANLFSRASGMAYMTLGSIVPSLAATFAIISLFKPLTGPDAFWIDRLKDMILQNLAPQRGAATVDQLEAFIAHLDVTAIGITGFGGLLVILVLLLRNIEQALNEIWLVKEVRPLLLRFVFFWTVLTLGILAASLTVGLMARLDLQAKIPFATLSESVVTMASSFFFFAFLYKFGPNCHVRVKPAIIGGLVATIMLRVASWGYGIYATNNQSYRNIYGALAAVPLFLLWLYVGWVVLLFGATVAWRLQQGFVVPRDKAASLAGPVSARERVGRLQQLEARAFVPILCVLAVYQRFQAAQGGGITGDDIARSLDIPPTWVEGALYMAESVGLVVLAMPLSTDEAQDDIMKRPVLPAKSPDALSLGEVFERLLGPVVQWLDERQMDLPWTPGSMVTATIAALRSGRSTKVPMSAWLDELKGPTREPGLG